MFVVGVDFSSFAVDVVRVHVDDLEPPRWDRFDLHGQDAFDRTRTVADAMPGRHSAFWDDVLAVGIEHPAGKWVLDTMRVQGAVLSLLPPRLLVKPWPPAAWRVAVGLPGNASKRDVMLHVIDKVAGWKTDQQGLEQDACDAYCIAVATRAALTREVAA